jgi:hypothetical protein
MGLSGQPLVFAPTTGSIGSWPCATLRHTYRWPQEFITKPNDMTVNGTSRAMRPSTSWCAAGEPAAEPHCAWPSERFAGRNALPRARIRGATRPRVGAMCLGQRALVQDRSARATAARAAVGWWTAPRGHVDVAVAGADGTGLAKAWCLLVRLIERKGPVVMHCHIRMLAAASTSALVVLAAACERSTKPVPSSGPSGAAGDTSASPQPRQGMQIPQPSGADQGPSPRPGGGASAAKPTERQPVRGTDGESLGAGGTSGSGGGAGQAGREGSSRHP